jgi:hypothetical protein
MNVMLRKLSIFLLEKNINFNPNNQHVRCLAHIINLAAKKTLENLYELNDFDEIEENLEIEEAEEESSEPLSIIYKVSFQLYKILYYYY